MRIQIGNSARGDDFFYRKNIIEETWEKIEMGSNLLIAAPRRVGKSSLLWYIHDNPKENYSFIFINTESINKTNEFFRRLVNRILKTEHVNKSQRVLTYFEENVPRIDGISLEGVEFGVKDELDYFEILVRIFKSLELQDQKIIVLLDEFSETLESIKNDYSNNEAKRFLKLNRELRQDLEINKYIQFIYTGSIGLENIVSSLNAINSINDLIKQEVLPLDDIEAKKLISELLNTVNYELFPEVIEYILNKIEWLIPFYIQLMIYELKVIHREENLNDITIATVDQAFKNMLEQRQHFEHWHGRLKESLKGNDYNFVKDVLNIISDNDTIEYNEIHNQAVKYNLKENFMDLIGSLVYDGYINNNEDKNIYRFNSPLVKIWWNENVAR